jgi:hypothetical protein
LLLPLLSASSCASYELLIILHYTSFSVLVHRPYSVMLPHVLLLAGFLHRSHAFSIPHVPRLGDFVGASHTQALQQPLQDSLDAWIEKEGRIALDKLLANIAPGGSNVQGKGVADGTVIASPSQESPDYWFQCEFRKPVLAINQSPTCI